MSTEETDDREVGEELEDEALHGEPEQGQDSVCHRQEDAEGDIWSEGNSV